MFQGNENLRGADETVAYTTEQLLEMKRCFDDPEYFIQSYIKIVNLDSESLVPFILRPYQKKMLDMVRANRFSLARWPRQSGKTVTVAIIALWHAIFFSNYRILIVANKHERARDILATIQQAYEHVPHWMQVGVKQWAKGSIELANGSVIKTAGTSGSAGRGGSFSMIFIDEHAFIPTHIAKDFFESVVPTISSGKSTKIVVSSTPRGLNHFYSLYKGAVEKKNGYAYLDIEWNEIPGRDENFRRQIIAAQGEQYFEQEFACAFLGSSYTLVSAAKLIAMSAIRPLVESPITRVYAHPEKGRQYVICADVSEGVMGDYSVATVFDVSSLPYRVVCVYRCNTISTMAYPQVLLNMARTYNQALVMVETTGIGQEVANSLLHDLEYENVALTEPSKRSLGRTLSGLFSGGKSSRVGLRMDKQARAIGCGKLKAMIENDQILVEDEWAIDELRRFSLGKGDKYEAEEGHDDVVMTLVAFAWMADQSYFRETNDLSAAEAVLERRRRSIEEDMQPLGFSTQDEPPPEVPIVASRSWWEQWANDSSKDPEPEREVWERLNQRYPD